MKNRNLSNNFNNSKSKKNNTPPSKNPCFYFKIILTIPNSVPEESNKKWRNVATKKNKSQHHTIKKI